MGVERGMDVERVLREANFCRNPEHEARLWRMLVIKRMQMDQAKASGESETESDILTEAELEEVAAGMGKPVFPEKRETKKFF